MKSLRLPLAAALCTLAAAGAAQNNPGSAAPHAPPDVAAPPPSARQDFPGVYTSRLAPPSGAERVTPNDCAVIRFTAWKRNGAIYSTSGVHHQTATQCLSTAMPGLAKVLTLMSPGEERRIWLSAVPASDDDLDEMLAPIPLTVDLQLIAVLKAPPTPANLHQPPPEAVRLPSGVSMLVLEKGSGRLPLPSSKLIVHFTGWTEAGKLVETTTMSGHPAQFPLSGAPAAWQDVLALMHPGEKVRLWIPEALASPGKPSGNRIYDLQLIRAQ